ncbi:unnamed protein product [Lymnaea stagnalis]|uniref:Uncharacterized protein n=1 Tax=Lymnaea stagnalis TaxID=6523 RepID=A0AAV2H418_LYMST
MGSPVVVASPRKSPSSGRRTNKPLVEKKRRARINGCLGQLKSLILSAMQTEGAQVSRLEKADILEMTVKYLRHIQHQQMVPEPEVTAKFSAGYTECASEVIRYIDTVKCVTPEVRSRLESHLVERLRGSAALTPAVPPSAQQPVQTPPSANKTVVYPAATTNMDETMTRHYQTAVELANMAASVVLQSNTRSSLTNIRQSSQASASLPETITTSQQLNLTNGHLVQQSSHLESAQNLNVRKLSETTRCLNRSQSMSPSALRAEDQDFRTSAAQFYHSLDERLRHNGSEPAMHLTSSSTSLAAPKQEIFYTQNDPNNNQPINLDYSDVVKSESEYLSIFQRPLHIHIPGSPHPLPSTSPQSIHPHQMGFHTQRSQGADPAHSPSITSMDDAPPTILYGYNGAHMASPYQKMETLSPCSPKTSGNAGGIGSSNEYMETFEQAEPRASNHFSHDTVSASNSRGGNHTPHVQSQHTRYPTLSPPTLSPPTLTREEPYPGRIGNPDGDELSHGGTELRQPSVMNRMSDCYMPESGPHSATAVPQVPRPASGCSNYSDQYPGQLNLSGQYQKQKEPDSYRPAGAAQPYNCGHQSLVSQDPSGRAVPHAKATDNGLHAMNGPATRHHPSVHSRQKDTSLSPPTLKRRILCALGSGGEWIAPKSEERFDLNSRERLQCVSDNGQNKLQRTDFRHETGTSLCRDGRGFPVPVAGANTYCRAGSSHSGADENLWRPW